MRVALQVLFWNPVCIGLCLVSACAYTPTAWDQLPVIQEKRVEYVPEEIVVKYRAPEGIRAAASLFPEDVRPTGPRFRLPGTHVLASTSFESQDDTALIKVPPGMTPTRLAAAYMAEPGVEWAIPNSSLDLPEPRVSEIDPGPRALPGIARIRVASSDPLSSGQWYLDRIGAPDAWQTTTGAGVTVAILDTGIDGDHPDLAGAVEPGADYVKTADQAKDQHGHGTHVAGIVGARRDNHIGIAGVAPGCSLLAVRVLDTSGRSKLFTVVRGIKWAADYGKRTGKRVVINLSLGSQTPLSPADFLAGWYANRQGALLVAAAGNDGGAVSVPARYRYFIAVGAVDSRDVRPAFSNFGSQLTLCAPGVNVLSTVPTYPVTMTTRGVPQNYASLGGTSMAAPMVSGVAALIWSKHADWRASQVREALTQSARPLGEAKFYGRGSVDAKAAVAL